MILLLDCNYLCRRAQHSMGALENGVLFGFFRDLLLLQDRFPDHRPVFCFDSAGSKRQEIFPRYKGNRERFKRDWTDDDKTQEREFYRQLGELRDEWLYEIGFANVFSAEGYEADDLIGAVCSTDNGDAWAAPEIVIVGSDKDFYQLISAAIRIWNPQTQELLTRRWFKKEYGISPEKWIKVKAMAGCKSDNIPGVRGVGELTALKYLRGEKIGIAASKIIARSGAEIAEYENLVRLPFPGCPTPEITADCTTAEKWDTVLKALDMQSLRGVVPGKRRKRVAK